MKVLVAAGCCVAAILLILLLIILFVKFKITVRVNNKKVRVFLGKIKLYDSTDSVKTYDEDDVVDKEQEFEEKYKKMKLVINFIRKVLDDKNDDIIYILKYAKKTISIKRLDISLDYGFDDAALTGITGGIIWILISGIFSFAGRFIDVKRFTNIAVKPYYTEKILDFKLEFVFSVRILHLLKTIRHVKRFKKTLEGRR